MHKLTVIVVVIPALDGNTVGELEAKRLTVGNVLQHTVVDTMILHTCGELSTMTVCCRSRPSTVRSLR